MPPLMSLCPRVLDPGAAGSGDDQAFRSADLRSKLRWDIAAIAPIRSINIYIFNVSPRNSPGRGFPPLLDFGAISAMG